MSAQTTRIAASDIGQVNYDAGVTLRNVASNLKEHLEQISYEHSA